MIVSLVLIITGFASLIFGANWLVGGASSLAKKNNISDLVIGLTIVAFGTSTPEFIINIFASANGNTEIAIGNILGSNIANILLILGVSAIIYPLATKNNTVWKEIPFMLLASVMLGILVNDMRIDNNLFSGLTRIDGLVLLAFFIVFLYYTFGISKITGDQAAEDTEIKEFSYLKSSIFIISGLLGLMIGGKWIVDGAVKIAELFHVSQSLIGLTVVAIGTSLPELATSAMAAYKKQTDIAIGNVVGSNIFNIFWVLGFSSLIRPLPFSAKNDIDIAMTIFSSTLLFLILFIGKKHIIEKWQGVLLVMVYIAYLMYLITNG